MNIYSKYILPAHQDPMIEYALQRIERDYGDICVVNRKDLNKFGGNPDVNTSEVSINSWGADEVFQEANVTLKMTSTSPLDAGKTINIEYMSIVDGNFVFGLMPNVSLDGSDPVANKVDLPAAGARWTRMYSDEQMVGDVYIYRDGGIVGGAPSDITTVHCHIPEGENQSQKAGTTIAGSNYFLIFSYWADLVGKANTQATIRLKIRDAGGTFRTVPRRGISSSGGLFHEYRSPIIIPPNSDIIMTAVSTSTNTDITAGFDGGFADII